MKKIYLSPSNNQNNIYSYGCTNEMEQCYKIAASACYSLFRCGFLAKKSPMGQLMYTTVDASNSFGSDLHICIHTQAIDNQTIGKTRVILYKNSDENKKAGTAILQEVAKLSIGSDYILEENKNIYELNSTNAIAIYLVVEFNNTVEGSKWVIDNAVNIGDAIAQGVCKYYGVKYIARDEKEDDTKTKSDNLYIVCKKWSDKNSQIGAFKLLDNAKKLADENSGYIVCDSKGNAIYSSVHSFQPVKLNLKNAPLYVSSTILRKSTTVNGTYYRFDDDVENGRVRITNSESNIGKKGQITGYIDYEYSFS